MRHFSTLTSHELDALFAVPPTEFNGASDQRVISDALGAMLYTRGTHPGLASVLERQKQGGTTSVVVCLEDAIGPHEVALAHANLSSALRELSHRTQEATPLLFCRVRHPLEILKVCAEDTCRRIVGFVIPKYSAQNGPQWLAAVRQASDARGGQVWAVPVLESAELADPLRRSQWLEQTRDSVYANRDVVLSIRIGAVDILGSLGLRRTRNLTSYDYGPLRDAISAIVGAFAGDREHGLSTSGCVWEHFSGTGRGPLAPGTPRISLPESEGLAADPLRARFGALVDELTLDRAHGLVGKSAIHPTQGPVINAWQAVTHEDYADATGVHEREGAAPSPYGNKMNESLPHRLWAERTVRRAKVFGVLRRRRTHRDLVGALVPIDVGRISDGAIPSGETQ